MNKTLYYDDGKNALRISKFDKFEGETRFNQLAAKFVVQGSETYVVNGKQFCVNQGEYILGNCEQLSEVIIKEQAVGLCLDISNKIIEEIVNTLYDNSDLNTFLLEDKFLINKYKSQNTTFGHRLQLLSKAIMENNSDSILMSELFYGLGENVVVDQALIFEQFSKLNFKNQEVNEATFRNLLTTKTYIDDCFQDALNIDELLEVARMSKFAFIRLFKTTFGISPYQYILQKRLIYAKSELLLGKRIMDVAIDAGFSDTAAFSKAFKQCFGLPPSRLKS